MNDYQEHFQWKKPDTQKSMCCIITLLESSKQAKQMYGGTVLTLLIPGLVAI